jgi:hypothetical protein
VDVHVSAFPDATTGYLQSTQAVEVILIAPWWPSQACFSGPVSQWQPIPSSCLKAVVQHLQAEGFSQEVAKLAAMPRRASTGKLYGAR